MKKIKAFFFVLFDHLRNLCLPEPEKGTMTSWAEREIELACKRERAGNDDPDGDEWDYGCACYESALRAYKSLMGDGHSGFSIGITKNILMRLIDGKPLTPIEDTDDVWNDVSRYGGGLHYQCKRMSSLFKDVREDGSYKYSDVNISYCVDINSKHTYHNGYIQKEIIDKMFPITMPYIPGEPMKVYCEDFLTDPKNGDYDTKGVFYIIKDGEKIEINRFFKDFGDTWAEITEPEYLERKVLAQKLSAKIADLNKELPHGELFIREGGTQNANN